MRINSVTLEIFSTHFESKDAVAYNGHSPITVWVDVTQRITYFVLLFSVLSASGDARLVTDPAP